MKARTLILTALALVFTATAPAQQLPPGRWWRVPQIVQALSLNEEQQNRLESIFRGAANELIDRRAEVEKLNIALRGELDRPQIDRQAIQRIAARLSEARGRQFEREVMMLVDMRAVLNDDQWARLRAQLDRMRSEKQAGRKR